MNKAVIVAAGLSSRLYPLTKDIPKSLLKINDIEIIKRNVLLLQKNGINDIYVVVGYLDNKIKEVLGNEVQYIFNPFYKHCNNMASLYSVYPFMNKEPFLYMHADVVFTEKLLSDFLKNTKAVVNKAIHLAVDFKKTDEEAMKVALKGNGDLLKSDKFISNENVGEWIGLALINDVETTFLYIEQALREEFLQSYDTLAFTRMANDGLAIGCQSINSEKWMEIDFVEDYEEAKRLFEDE